jgi:hypothetical protein
MDAELNQSLIEALDHCLGQMQQGKPIQDCAAQYPQYPQLVELLQTATAIQHVVPLTMPAKQSDRLEQQLLGQFQTMQAVPQKATNRTMPHVIQYWSFRLLLAACAIIVIFFTGVGITSASASTLPGDNLYGLKRIVEQIQLQFSTSEAVRNQVYAHIADQRLYEATLLTLQNKPLDTNFISDTVNTLDAAQRYNLSPEIQMLLEQHMLYLSALIKQKPAQTTVMAQFAVNLDHFVATTTAPVIAPEITATPTLTMTMTTSTTTSIPMTNTATVSQTPQSDYASTGTITVTATLIPVSTLTGSPIAQPTSNTKPVHPTQKPLPPQANPNAGNGNDNGKGKGH